ncbi:MAG: hypothetical protein ABIE84_01170 [bacterium]
MKTFVIILLSLLIVSTSFALSGTGLPGTEKTLGYYLMPTRSMSSYSSGLVYNARQGEKMALEVIYTAYRSPILLSSNITQLGIHEKLKLAQLGPVGVIGVAGLGILYRSTAGVGVTGNFGLIGDLIIIDDLTINMPIYISVLSDGSWTKLSPTVNYRFGLLPDYEFFAGMNIDMQMQSSAANSESVSPSMYFVLGAKKAI